MADENIQAQDEAVDEPQGEPKAKTDWKAEARKWEALAKKGKAAEEELAAMKEAQMTEQEKANARAEKAEAELKEMKAEAERLQTAHKLAESENIPFDLLELVSADRIEEFAKRYKGHSATVHSAAPSLSMRLVKEGGAVSNRDAFAAFADAQLNHR